MRYVFVAALLWPCIALAEDALDEVVPKPANRHQCLRELDQWTKWSTVKGLTGLRATKVVFRIGTDGAVKNLAVAIASEDAVSDALAVKCVERWRYEPVIQNGQPVELPWYATISMFSKNEGEPHEAEFDAAASDPAVQSCMTMPAAAVDAFWSRASAYKSGLGDNDSFECLRASDGQEACRAKPGTALYPTVATTTFYSTGTRLKIGVEVRTAGDCKAATPLTFKDRLPVR
jgi:TonB family protein